MHDTVDIYELKNYKVSVIMSMPNSVLKYYLAAIYLAQSKRIQSQIPLFC